MSPSRVLLILGVVCLGVVQCNPSVSFAVPAAVLNEELQKALPNILQAMDEVSIPATCCYGGPDEIHAMFRGNTLVKSAYHVSGSLTSAPSGLNVALTATVRAQSGYDICVHDDPFGKGCSSVDGCKGTGVSQITGTGAFTAVASVTSAGALELVPHNPTVTAAVTQNSFCGKIASGINNGLKSAEPKIAAMMVEKGTAVFNEVTAKLRQFVTKDATLDLSYARAGTDAVALSADAAVVVVRGGAQYAVTAPRAIPSAASFTAGNRFAVVFSEGVFNTLCQIAFAGGLLKGEMNSTLLGQNVTVDWVATGAPTVTINPSANPLTLAASVGIRLTTTAGKLVSAPHMNILIGGALTYNATQKGFILQVAFQNATFTNATLPLQQAIATDIRTAIPSVNAALAGLAVPLPTPKDATLSDPRLTFGAGYAVLTAGLSLNIVLPPSKPLVLKCPDIKDFHLDGCL